MDMETEENHGLPGFAQGYGAEGPDDQEIAREAQATQERRERSESFCLRNFSRLFACLVGNLVLRHSDFVIF